MERIGEENQRELDLRSAAMRENLRDQTQLIMENMDWKASRKKL
jgi:hypothetical protein